MILTLSTLKRDLCVALADARRHKGKMSYVRKFHADLKENILRLATVLFMHIYVALPSKCFIVDHPKKREVFAAQFSGSCGPSSILQLYTSAVRSNVHPRQLFVHREPWYARWRDSPLRSYPQGEPELDAGMLHPEARYPWILDAHRPQAIVGDMSEHARQNGQPQVAKGYAPLWCCDMGAGSGYGLYKMADGADCDARSEDVVRKSHAGIGLGRSRSCQVAVLHRGRTRTANRKLDEPTVIERLSQLARPVHETDSEMSPLRSICGRFLRGVMRQGLVAQHRTARQSVLENGTGSGSAHGKGANIQSVARCGVPGCIHQTVSHLYVERYDTACPSSPVRNELQRQGCRSKKREQLPRYYGSHILIQSAARTLLPARVPAHRLFRRGYDKDDITGSLEI